MDVFTESESLIIHCHTFNSLVCCRNNVTFILSSHSHSIFWSAFWSCSSHPVYSGVYATFCGFKMFSFMIISSVDNFMIF